MVAAGFAGCVSVGIDIEFEAVQAARRVMRDHGLVGYVVVADLGALPFQHATFDYVFSYSAIQHVDRGKAITCVSEIERVLKVGGLCCVELPLKHGLTNWRHFLRKSKGDDNADCWKVRYYTWRELDALFSQHFGNVQISCDCFGGVGVRPEDIDLPPWHYKPIVILSEILKFCTRVFPPLKRLSDSVFLQSRKRVSRLDLEVPTHTRK
jgi:SAM-dependent methyltransferase